MLIKVVAEKELLNPRKPKFMSLKEFMKQIKWIGKKREELIQQKYMRRRYFNRVNKFYKKLNWKNKYMRAEDVEKMFSDRATNVNYFLPDKPRATILRMEDVVDENGKYPTKTIEKYVLVRELMGQMDDMFWQPYTPPKKRKKRERKKKRNINYVPYYFDSVYQGSVYICAMPESKLEKSKLVTEYLRKKEFLFDKDSPYFKGNSKVRRFVMSNLIYGKPEKWDYYVERFLTTEIPAKKQLKKP